MNRFFVDLDLFLHKSVVLPDNVFHHWIRVLRAKLHDTAILFNGKNGEYLVELIEINKKDAVIQVINYHETNRALPFDVCIGLVMSKGDRMDYAIQKSTELGVRTIQLLTSERCEMRLKYERDQKKIEHWQGVAIAACEQCGLNIVPQILAPQPLEQWVGNLQADLKLVMALSDGQVQFPSPLPKQIALLIGAEGGLSEQEIAFACHHDFKPWTIGERVLRTETAPVVALSILNMLNDR